ncbi:TIR domain-containing protein [Rubrobacter aplysinae]|uniref:TIR domain-containing protein n=1 Tax=Rubrobacter aplysinae TaxID=909625 RepID=UPI00064C437E|nr:TIR domain-containing protein [Rubrobacter aplysinae]
MSDDKRIFIAFAIEDRNSRDFLKGQSLNTNSLPNYIDMSAKEPWDNSWKTNCRTRIKGCDGVIALLSSNSMSSDGEKWEITCAKDEGVPLIGVHIHSNDSSSPSEMNGVKKIKWDQSDIAEFIDGL